jgi:hypothetical protein
LAFQGGTNLSAPTPPPKPSRLLKTRSIILWVGTIVVLGGVWIVGAAVSGIRAGQDEVTRVRSAQNALALQEQFNLGMEDLLAGRFELALQRFDYLLSVDPNYPGAAEFRDQVLLALAVPTPTPVPTLAPASPTPTLDVSSLDGLFAQAQLLFSQGDWSGTLVALLELRKRDASFRTTEVNTLMASSLRNRGVDKIMGGHYEPGIYDLALAERFGPLDNTATSWRNSAIFYLQANSYFGLDGALAVQYFSQLCGAGAWDSCFKFARSAQFYGDQLLAQKQYCPAATQYRLSLETLFNDKLGPTAEYGAQACLTATAATPTMTATPTPTPGSVTPEITITPPVITDTLTPTITSAPSTETETPTATPSPSATTPG